MAHVIKCINCLLFQIFDPIYLNEFLLLSVISSVYLNPFSAFNLCVCVVLRAIFFIFYFFRCACFSVTSIIFVHMTTNSQLMKCWKLFFSSSSSFCDQIKIKRRETCSSPKKKKREHTILNTFIFDFVGIIICLNVVPVRFVAFLLNKFHIILNIYY